MRVAAVLFNILVFLFTCVVLVTEGPPRGASYVTFTAWVLLTLILNSVLMAFGGTDRQREPAEETGGRTLSILAIVCNIVFLGFVCWAITDQYPHPEEDGVIVFAVLMVLTPVLSLIVLWRDRAGAGRTGFHLS